MNDYYEFKHVHDIQIGEWGLYWCSNYVSITRGIVALNGAMETHNISSTNGNENTNGNGSIRNVIITKNCGTTKGGGARASTNTWGLTRPQIPCVTQRGSKKLDLRNWLEIWCRSQLPALKGVEGSCWKLRD